MKQIAISTLLVILAAPLATIAASPVPNQIYSMVTKSVYYTQSQSDQLVLDPLKPYGFSAWAEYSPDVAPIINATLSGDFGSVLMEKVCSLSKETIGVNSEVYYTNKTDMDVSFPDDEAYVFNVKFPSATNTFTNRFNTSVTYAPQPIISAVSNCSWNSEGYITILDANKPFTISWPGSNLQSIISIRANSSTDQGFSGFSKTLNGANQFTFPVDLISSLPRGVIIPVSFEDWVNPTTSPYGNAYNSFNTFSIFVPPRPFEGNSFILGKTHVLLQTNTVPVDYSRSIGVNGTIGMSERGPYNFRVTSPIPCSISSPTSSTLTTTVSENGFNYFGGGLPKTSLDLAYPNGTYKVSTGQSLQLTEDRYPSIPKVLSVNGRPPQWINGELILNAGQPNRITWAKFKAYASFKQCAYETYELNCTDYGNLSSGGTITNASICPLIGLAGNNVTSITLGPTVLKHNVNYILTLQYSAITSATTQPVLSGAFYSSKVIVPIIAQQLKKVAPR